MRLNRRLLMRNNFHICSSRLLHILTVLFKILFLSFLVSCDNTPVSSGAKADELKLLFYNVRNITTTTATVLWAYFTFSKSTPLHFLKHPASYKKLALSFTKLAARYKKVALTFSKVKATSGKIALRKKKAKSLTQNDSYLRLRTGELSKIDRVRYP